MAQQSNWRFCQKCNSMFFGGYSGGKCPAGGGHTAQGYNFVLPYDTSAPNAQDNWRYCQKCDAMFWAGYGGGVCPAGGSHSAQGFNFVLPHDVPSAPGSQANWRFCQACNELFFGGYAGGRCPAGGAHKAQGYNFVLPYQDSSVNPAIANVPWDKYVDQFTSCVFDVNYHVPADASFYFSPILQLKYADGVALELNIEKDFSDVNLSSEAARDAMAQAYLGRSGRIFPRVLVWRTVPRLWAAREEAFRITNEEVDSFSFLASTGVMMALDVPAMPAGAAMQESSIASTKVTRRQLSGRPPGGAGGGFREIPYGQSADSLGQTIGSRASEGSTTSRLIGETGPSWINRIIAAVRRLGLAPGDSVQVIESATTAAKFGHGPRALLEDGTLVVTSARAGPNNFVIGVRPDGSVVRGMATIDMGPNIPGGVKVTNVEWQ